jgi:hypothetical protein
VFLAGGHQKPPGGNGDDGYETPNGMVSQVHGCGPLVRVTNGMIMAERKAFFKPGKVLRLVFPLKKC